MKGLYKADELSNAQYHANAEYYSSSQLKDAIDDIEYFHLKYILKRIERKEIPAFAIGTYYHTAILEPERLYEECAVFSGKIRSGKKWIAFKEENADKAIITMSELTQAENLIEATRKSPRSMEFLEKGVAETSCFTELDGLKVRVRSDWMDVERGFIMDLKSTTGPVKNPFKIQQKVANYQYDLSAAMYLDAFNQEVGGQLTDFYWVFASKDQAQCKAWKATDKMLEIGRRKYRYAISQIRKFKALGWNFVDEIGDVDPSPWEESTWKDMEPVEVPIEEVINRDIDLI